MKSKTVTLKSFALRALVLIAALTWVAADVASAGQTSARSSRSASPSSKSSTSGSKARAPSSSGSSDRKAVSRSSSGSRSTGSRGSVRSRGSGSSTRSGSGAARTRSGQRPEARRGGGGHSRYYGGYYGGYYGRPYYWNPWGYWGWGLSVGHGYGAYGHGYGHGYGHYPPVAYSSRPGYRMGALDLKVQPKNTEIYIDGQYVGLARQYDGFPGHLWLEKGVYEVGFFRPGFETQTRTVKVLTDLILDLDVDMQPGEAVKPEMRFGPDEMDRDDHDQHSDDEIAGWRQLPSRGDYQARLHLDVEPAQALVYLDGNVLGTADELAGLHAGLIVSAGTHTLEVVHRGFVTVERSIKVEPGEEIDFDLRLEPAVGNASP